MTWNETFLSLFDRCLHLYQNGNKDYTSYYRDEDLTFLKSIGYKPRELFDFIEDLADEGQPARSTALLIAAARRDYFLIVQNGEPSTHEITSADLPTFGDTLGDIPYLPRLIKKAEHKLRGELDPDLMYGCGGDRKFLREHSNLHPADFLRHTWAANGDHTRLLELVTT